MTAPSPGPPFTPPETSPDGPAALGSQWARLHPLTPVLRSWRVLGVVAAISVQDGLRRGGFSGLQLLLTVVVVVPVSALLGYVSWRRRRWRVEGGDLRLDYGIVTRKSRRVPLARLQAIDVVRPLLARALGLAELRLEVVGHGSSEATLAYLTEAHALEVRTQLLDLAHRPVGRPPAPQNATALQAPSPLSAPPAPAPPDAGQTAAAAPAWGRDDEALLTAVPAGRFVASLILSAAGGVSFLFVAAVLVAALVAPAGAGAIAAGLLPIGATIYRRFTVEFGFTVALSPQGVRIRHGLLDTRQQTVPRGRVQALRIVEPLLWRRFGWLRVEVDVAGNRSAAGRAQERSDSGVLLPVGLRAEVEGVIHSVLPGLDLARLPTQRPPKRARWREPLSYHNLGAALDAGFSVTTYGRIRRVTDIVPNDKLQSVRLVEGPWQRKLKLASVHLDTAGRNVHAAIRHWDVEQAAELTDTLAEFARSARSRNG